MVHDVSASASTSPTRRSWSSGSHGGATTPSIDHSDVEYAVSASPHKPMPHGMLPLSPMRQDVTTAPIVDNNDPILEAKPKDAPSAAKAAPPPNPASKILFLDGLRGLAAMMVVVQHGGYMGLMVGQPAVDIFFVLSAFLLTMIFEKKARTLIKEKANWKRWCWALLDYFARRFLRVYPLFMLSAIYLNFYSPAQKEKLFFVHHPEEWNLFKVLVFEFKYRYHVYWTLPLEITYYFMIPVFAVFILVLRKFWIIPLLPLGYLVAYSGFYWIRTDHQGLRPHLPTFIVGSMAAIVYAKAENFVKTRNFVFRWYHWIPIGVVEMFFLGVLFSVFFDGLFFHWWVDNPIKQTKTGGRFVSAQASIIIVCEMLLPGVVSSVLEWSLLRFAGKVSFSMYLLHSFVLYSDFVGRQTYYYDRFFAIWGLVFIVSTASYYAIEYPGQKLATYVGKLIKAKDMAEKQRCAQALPVTTPRLQTV